MERYTENSIWLYHLFAHLVVGSLGSVSKRESPGRESSWLSTLS